VTGERARDAAFAQAKMRDRVVTYVIDRIRNEAEPEAMLNAAAGVLARATNADAAAIYLEESDSPMAEAARFGEPPAETVLAAWLDDLGANGPMLEEIDHGAGVLAHATAYRGRVNGAIALWRRDAGQDWRDDDRSLLAAVTGQLGVVLTQIIDQRGLERVSRTDGLTGLLNRAAFMTDLDQCLARAMVRETPGVLIYLDLDNFKPVNDVLGHDQGDAVLRRIADVLRGMSRRHDLVARLGGDEFAIWLDDAAGEAGCAKAQSICAALERMRDFSASAEQPLGGSIGVAVYAPDNGEDVDALIKRADVAMYRAKRAGKNDWRLAPPILAETGPETDRG